MNTIDDLLSRLAKVQPTGRDSWKACCPAHEDRDPSLTIRHTQDGTILLHCFAECSAADVCAAVGLTLADLFPPPDPLAPKPAHKPRGDAGTMLKMLSRAATVVYLAGATLDKHGRLSDADRAALRNATNRIRAVMEVM